jgi:hypothetical protein
MLASPASDVEKRAGSRIQPLNDLMDLSGATAKSLIPEPA